METRTKNTFRRIFMSVAALAVIAVLYFKQCIGSANAQVAVDSSSVTELTTDQPANNPPTNLPDSLCVTLEGQPLCLPTGDGQAAGVIIKEFIDKNKGQWPKDVLGWILLIGGFLLSAPGTALLANATRVYYFLRSFLRKTLHVVAFIAGVFSVAVTFLFGQLSGNGFNIAMFMSIWPVVAFGAVYVYENWIKKDDFVEPETAKATANA